VPLPSAPWPLFGRLRRREILHGERSPEHPLADFSPWTVEPSFLPPPLHLDAGPPPATGALTSSENATADPVFPSSRWQEAPVSYRLHPHARRVASPSWVLERHPLVHLRHGSAAAGRAAPRSRGPRRPRPARQAMGHMRCAHGPSRCCGRGPRTTVQLGQARIRPSDSRISFLFSEYIQILVNLKKNCAGFI
jgi:hypothetical protein